MMTCENTGFADELLAKYGDMTYAVEPNISFIPTVVFNSTFNQTLQNNALDDFLWTACSILGDAKPKDCPEKSRAKKAYPSFGFFY